jgi:hypothetical protein
MLDLKRSFLVVSLLIVCGVTAANAQWREGSSLNVDIPNSFTLNDKVLPAGKYTIERSPVAESLLLLRGEGRTMFFSTLPVLSANASKGSKLIFDKVGDSYFLSEIWVSGATAADAIPKSRSQKEAIARNKTTRTTIVADDSF